MKVTITLPANATNNEVHILKRHIDQFQLSNLENISIDVSTQHNGSMGLGAFVNSVTAVITASQGALIELIKCVQAYVTKYRTEIDISIGEKHVKIKTDNSKDDEAIVKSIIEALK